MLFKYGKINLNSKKYWDEIFLSKQYKECEATENMFKAMVNMVRPNSKVLDVGCGTGYFLKCLKKGVTDNVFALDISSVTIANLNREGIQGVCSKLPNIPYKDETFDYVTAKALLEHLRKPAESIDSMVRLLKTGGKLLVSVPNNILGPEDEPEHFRKYTKESLYSELDEHITVDEIKVIGNSLLAISAK